MAAIFGRLQKQKTSQEMKMSLPFLGLFFFFLARKWNVQRFVEPQLEAIYEQYACKAMEVSWSFVWFSEESALKRS